MASYISYYVKNKIKGNYNNKTVHCFIPMHKKKKKKRLRSVALYDNFQKWSKLMIPMMLRFVDKPIIVDLYVIYYYTLGSCKS